MLILSRREGDSILIDGGIRIVVIACDRRGVRLGIEAPPEVSIVRGEIVNQIADANRASAASSDAKHWLDVVPMRPSQPVAVQDGTTPPPSEPAAASDAPRDEPAGTAKPPRVRRPKASE